MTHDAIFHKDIDQKKRGGKRIVYLAGVAILFSVGLAILLLLLLRGTSDSTATASLETPAATAITGR